VQLISRILLFKDKGTVLDCCCAGLIPPVQKAQEQNSVFFREILSQQGLRQACEDALSLLVQRVPYM